MKIEIKKISELKPADYNPRKSSITQDENLRKSLEKFGVVEPIVFNQQTGNIVGGHFRVRQLKKLGYKEVECVIVDLPLEDEKELNIRLNANTGEFDWEILQSWDSSLLEEWGVDLPGFETEQDFSDKNKEIDAGNFDDEMIIKLKYTEDEYLKVRDQLSKIAETPEQAVWKLLGNE